MYYMLYVCKFSFYLNRRGIAIKTFSSILNTSYVFYLGEKMAYLLLTLGAILIQIFNRFLMAQTLDTLKSKDLDCIKKRTKK